MGSQEPPRNTVGATKDVSSTFGQARTSAAGRGGVPVIAVELEGATTGSEEDVVSVSVVLAIGAKEAGKQIDPRKALGSSTMENMTAILPSDSCETNDVRCGSCSQVRVCHSGWVCVVRGNFGVHMDSHQL